MRETARTIAGQARTGAVTCRAVAEEAIAAVEAVEGTVRAFVDFRPEPVLAQAERLDALPEGARGPLHGVPVAVKEIYDVAGMECAWGSRIHAGRVPERDCNMVSILRRAGALIVGTTVSTEYAMSFPGPTRNPHDKERSPGGSSSGSAAITGGGALPVALGSQTVGSIIRPSAYCGAVGYKPTWGAISAAGVMILCEQFDHLGFITRTVDDAVFAASLFVPGLEGSGGAGALRVLRLPSWTEAPFAPEVEQALDTAAARLESRGIAVAELTLPDSLQDEGDTHQTILNRAIADHHGADRDRAPEKMSEVFQGLVDAGRAVSDADYARALQRRNEIVVALDRLLPENAVFLTAAATELPPRLGEGHTGSRLAQRLWTHTGMPAVTVPVTRAGPLPVGVQIVARRGADADAFSIARMLEAAE